MFKHVETFVTLEFEWISCIWSTDNCIVPGNLILHFQYFGMSHRIYILEMAKIYRTQLSWGWVGKARTWWRGTGGEYRNAFAKCIYEFHDEWHCTNVWIDIQILGRIFKIIPNKRDETLQMAFIGYIERIYWAKKSATLVAFDDLARTCLFRPFPIYTHTHNHTKEVTQENETIFIFRWKQKNLKTI